MTTHLVFLNGNRLSVQVAGAGHLAGRRADPAGEFRKAEWVL